MGSKSGKRYTPKFKFTVVLEALKSDKSDAEVLLGAPPSFVLIGGIAMVVAVSWLGVAVAQMKLRPEEDMEVRA